MTATRQWPDDTMSIDRVAGSSWADEAIIGLRTVSWKGYKKSKGGVPGSGTWVARTAAGSSIIEVRKGILLIPFVAKRILAHEIEHLIFADFASNDDHHDSEVWARTNETAPHYCGRSFSWRGFLSMRHLRTPPRLVSILRSKGAVLAPCEVDSKLYRQIHSKRP